MWGASGVRGGEPMNGAAAQRSATDLGNLTALTDDVDVMSINITRVSCCMEGPKVRIARQMISPLFFLCPWKLEPGYPPSTKLFEPVRRMQLGASETTNAITESDGLRTMGIMS